MRTQIKNRIRRSLLRKWDTVKRWARKPGRAGRRAKLICHCLIYDHTIAFETCLTCWVKAHPELAVKTFCPSILADAGCQVESQDAGR